MRSVLAPSCLLLLAASAQLAPAQPAKPAAAELYHVSFFRAAPGKAALLGEDLKGRAAKNQIPGHFLILRHQSGDDWDYVTIEHLGTKATVDAQTSPPPASSRDLVEWHDDTFTSGPAWPEVSRSLGIGGQNANAKSWVYVVAVHRALPAHREQLEKILRQALPGGAGSVILSHQEGGAWNFLAIDRYNSWQDFAAAESKSQAQAQQGSGGWYQIREHVIWHRDTIAHRVAP